MINLLSKIKIRKNTVPLYTMLIPGIVIVFIFCYIPMYGIKIAFQNFIPAMGLLGVQKWIGLDNFIFAFTLPDSGRVIKNTIYIASMKIILGTSFTIAFSLILNEVRKNYIKRIYQTLVYIPYFMSWILLSGILIDILSVNGGLINQLLIYIGIKPKFFLMDNSLFPWVMIISDIWKNFGFNSVIYLAAITSIDPTLYESAIIDGASRLKQTRYITIPSITYIIVLMMILSIGNILNAGFDQIFNLYNPIVYKSGDIIDTLVYRIGLVQAQYGLSTAIGLFKSIVSLILISISYYAAYKYADYRIF